LSLGGRGDLVPSRHPLQGIFAYGYTEIIYVGIEDFLKNYSDDRNATVDFEVSTKYSDYNLKQLMKQNKMLP